MNEKSQLPLSTPGAIIIGAIIIGLAVVFAFSNNRSENTQPSDNRPTVEESAKKVRIDQKDLAACIEEDRHGDTVRAHIENAQAMEASGTPFSVLVSNTDRFAISGALPEDIFQKVIDIMRAGTPRSETTFAMSDAQEIFTYIMEEEVLPTISDDMTEFLLLPDPATDHERGATNPKITIIEYSDIDCPFCTRLHTTMQNIIDKNNDVQWIYRHLPITSRHPEAYGKAVASECVYELSGQSEEAFWSYLDNLIDA